MNEKKSNAVPMMKIPEKIDLSTAIIVGDELKNEFVTFKHEELDAMKDELVNGMSEMEHQEGIFAEVAKTHRDKMKELRIKSKMLVMDIKREGREQMITCRKVPDFDLGIMFFCEKETGRVVASRKLMPNERQTDINNMR